MKKHVIALGRQFGSGGREIGRKLSESLGFAYYDRELLKLAAERAEVGEELFADKDEKAGNPWLFKAFYQGGPKVKQGQSAEDVLFQMQSEIIRELAEKEDCIIVGRCADLVLTGQDVDCLSLFICAPFEWRVHHRMELENLDEKAARALVEKTDAQREKYYTHYTGRPWGLPENYDKEEFARIKAAAARIKADSQALVVIGIGGSYLGARGVIECLRSPNYNLKKKETPNIYFVGNGLSSDYMSEIVELAAGCSLTEEEAVKMLRLMWEMKGKDETC